jgi:hypothetical protein
MLALLVLAAAAQADPLYVATRLPAGRLSRNAEVQGIALNVHGEVVAQGLGSRKAYRWTAEDGLQALADLPGGNGFTSVAAINDHGQIVGTASQIDPKAPRDWNPHAVLWGRDGQPHDLQPALGHKDLSHPYSYGYDINSDGTAVALLSSITFASNSIVLRRHLRTTLPTGYYAYHLADGGATAGLSNAGISGSVAIYRAPDGSFDVIPAMTAVNDLNADGLVVGVSVRTSDNSWVATTWSRASGLRELPRPEGFTSCQALGVNRGGTVVGWCANAGVRWQPSHAVVWYPGPAGYTVTDLHTVIVGGDEPAPACHVPPHQPAATCRQVKAVAVNDAGQILMNDRWDGPLRGEHPVEEPVLLTPQ